MNIKDAIYPLPNRAYEIAEEIEFMEKSCRGQEITIALTLLTSTLEEINANLERIIEKKDGISFLRVDGAIDTYEQD